MLGVQARPARVGPEERNAQLGVPLKDAAGDERGHRHPICSDW